jgi:hypothetical protein
MSEWNELIARLTERLTADEELRLDVARELRSHLEDSADEFRRAGESPEQAAASAERALGNLDELAEQLWQANRKRMRLRGVLRWAAQTALVPLAILVILALIGEMTGRYPDYSEIPGLHHPAGILWHPDSGLTESQRFVLGGPAGATSSLEQAKAISNRWPDNPVYYGNFVAEWTKQNLDLSSKPTAEGLQAALVILERGKQLDPNNAFYDFYQAAYLAMASSDLTEEPNAGYPWANRSGGVTTRPYQQIVITDRRQFERAIAVLRSGLAKPKCAEPEIDMLRLRLDLLPPPRRIYEYLQRIVRQTQPTLFSVSHFRWLAKDVMGAGLDAAKAGRAAEAQAYLDLADRFSAFLGANAETIIQLLVARAIRADTLTHAERAYAVLGQREQAEKTHQDLLAVKAAFSNQRKQDDTLQPDPAKFGMLGYHFASGFPGRYYDPEPLRTAEHVVAMEFALVVLLAGLLFITLLWGLATLVHMFRRKENRPILVFVGWRQVGRICLYAVVLPLGVFGIYRSLSNDSNYGLVRTYGKVLLELVVLISVVLELLCCLSYSAVRRRAEELGLKVPAPIRLREWRWTVTLGVVIALVVAGYLVVSLQAGDLPRTWSTLFPLYDSKHLELYSTVGFVLSLVIAAYLVLLKLREYLGRTTGRQYRHFRRTYRRSTIPILAAAVILLGVVLGWGLAKEEAAAVGRATGAADISLSKEIAHSSYRYLKEEFVQRQRELVTQPLPAPFDKAK